MAQRKERRLVDRFKEGAEKAKQAASAVVADDEATRDTVAELLAGFKDRAGRARTTAADMVSDEKVAELIINVTHKVKRINGLLEEGESEFVIASFDLTVGLGVPEITLSIGRR
jgi:hypothetical protein